MDSFAASSRSLKHPGDPTGRGVSGKRLQLRRIRGGLLSLATGVGSIVFLLLAWGSSASVLHATPRPGPDREGSPVAEGEPIRHFEVVCDTPCPERVIAM